MEKNRKQVVSSQNVKFEVGKLHVHQGKVVVRQYKSNALTVYYATPVSATCQCAKRHS